MIGKARGSFLLKNILGIKQKNVRMRKKNAYKRIEDERCNDKRSSHVGEIRWRKKDKRD